MPSLLTASLFYTRWGLKQSLPQALGVARVSQLVTQLLTPAFAAASQLMLTNVGRRESIPYTLLSDLHAIGNRILPPKFDRL